MKSMPRFVSLCVFFALGWMGCGGGDGVTVQVRVVSDLVAGPEVVRAKTALFTGTNTVSSTLVATVERNLRLRDPLPRGMIVATLRDVEPGTYTVQLDLLRSNGQIAGGRPVTVSIEGDATVTVHITADCAGVECPNQGGPALTACLHGTCVDPACTPENPSACPANLFCNVDTDCSGEGVCSTSSCVDGVCVDVPREGVCGEEEYCTRGGCAPLAMPELPSGPDPRCGTICTLPDAPCVYGYYACIDTSVVCTPFLARPVGSPCANGRICDEVKECVEAPVTADGGVNIDSGTGIDAATPRDMGADAARDAAVDMARDSAVVPPDAAAAPEALFETGEFVVTEFGARLGVQETIRFKLSRRPSAGVLFQFRSTDEGESRGGLRGSIGGNSVFIVPDDWDEYSEVYVRGVDDDENDGDVVSRFVATVTSDDPTFDGMVGVEVSVVTVDDDGIETIFRDGMNFDARDALGGDVGHASMNTDLFDLSDDGRYVIYQTDAPSLGAPLVPGWPVYEETHAYARGMLITVLHDRATARNTRVVIPDTCTGLLGSRGAYQFGGIQPRLTGDGSGFAFRGVLGPIDPDTGCPADFGFDRPTGIFFYDFASSALETITSTTDGMLPNGTSTLVDISTDGRYIVFESTASNLVSGGGAGIFRHDRESGETTNLANWGNASGVTMSGDGNFIAYHVSSGVGCQGWALPGSDRYCVLDVEANTFTEMPYCFQSMSATGRAVLNWCTRSAYDFSTMMSTPFDDMSSVANRALDSLDGETVVFGFNGGTDVLYVGSTVTGTSRLLSGTPEGVPGDGRSYDARIAGGGDYVAFWTTSTNISHRPRGGVVVAKLR